MSGSAMSDSGPVMPKHFANLHQLAGLDLELNTLRDIVLIMALAKLAQKESSLPPSCWSNTQDDTFKFHFQMNHLHSKLLITLSDLENGPLRQMFISKMSGHEGLERLL